METLMTILDVAEKTRLSQSAIRKHVFNRTIPFIKIGAAIRFRPSDIDGWINARAKGSTPDGTNKKALGVLIG